MSHTTAPPDGLGERSPGWHMDKMIEFTKFKQQVGEPSPHLAMVGHMSKDAGIPQTLWMLGTYAATYSLPTAQVMWTEWPWDRVISNRQGFNAWLVDNWKGIITRTERRCVRTAPKMTRCLNSYMDWAQDEFPRVQKADASDLDEYYELVWKSVNNIAFFGRYISIRLIEGLRRYAGLPVALRDVRSLGGWSPKKCLVYLYPEHKDMLLTDTPAGNYLTDKLAEEVLYKIQLTVPTADYYVVAAMLCEYREYFEDRHQYPGWTIDQEPLKYDKVKEYWGDTLSDEVFWGARKALFPQEVLGEFNDWNGTRWDLTKTLRDHGYIWNDKLYDYKQTTNFAQPVPRSLPN